MKKIMRRKYKEFASGAAFTPFNRQILTADKCFDMDNMTSNSKAYRLSGNQYMHQCPQPIDDIILFGAATNSEHLGYSRKRDKLTSKFTLIEPNEEYPDGKYAYWAMSCRREFTIFDEDNVVINHYYTSSSQFRESNILYVKDTAELLYVMVAFDPYVALFTFNKETHEIIYYAGHSLLSYVYCIQILDDEYLGSSNMVALIYNNSAYDTSYGPRSRVSYFSLDNFQNSMTTVTVSPSSVGTSNDTLADDGNYTWYYKQYTDFEPHQSVNEFRYNVQFINTNAQYDHISAFYIIEHNLLLKTFERYECTFDYGVLTEDDFKDILAEFCWNWRRIITFTTPAPYEEGYEDEILHMMTRAQDVESGYTYIRFIQFRYSINPLDPTDVTIKLFGTQKIDSRGNGTSSAQFYPAFLNKENTHMLRNANWDNNATSGTIELRYDHWNGWYNLQMYYLSGARQIDLKNKTVWDMTSTGNVYSYDTYSASTKFIHIKGFEDIDYNGAEVTYELEVTSGYLDKMVESTVTLQIISDNAVFDNGTPEGISGVELTTSVDQNNPTTIQIRITNYGNVQLDGSALSYEEYLYIKNESLL